MGDTTYISQPRACDFEAGFGVHGEAVVDGRTTEGYWANMCQRCWDTMGVGRLGTGFGQRLVVGEEPKRDRHAEFDAALAAGASNTELEDIIGDEDIASFL